MEQSLVKNFKGKSKEIGISIGDSIGNKRFSNNINKMIEAVDKSYGINFEKLEKEAMLWLESVPNEYQKELEGISIGSGCAIEKIAQWYYSSMCTDGGCTSFFIKINDLWWVGRNNDYLLPEFWGHVSIIEVEGKIPVILFGLEGDIFTGTGFNKEKLWIHYNWLPVWDTPLKSKEVIAPFIFVRKALENCKSINDVEMMLEDTVRDSGMNLFIIDGKNNEAAVFECTCRNYKKRLIEDFYIAGANHYCALQTPKEFNFDFSNSINRQTRTEKLLLENKEKMSFEIMMDILADSKIEQNNNLSGTIYSNIACPSKDLIWFAYNGFPAASESDWKKVVWEW
mgnify:CR=1 FL=1